MQTLHFFKMIKIYMIPLLIASKFYTHIVSLIKDQVEVFFMDREYWEINL